MEPWDLGEELARQFHALEVGCRRQSRTEHLQTYVCAILFGPGTTQATLQLVRDWLQQRGYASDFVILTDKVGVWWVSSLVLVQLS